VDAAQAIADLTEISSQIEGVVLADSAGAILGTNLEGDGRATRLAEGAARLLEEAAATAAGREGSALTQLEAAMPEGSVFVVRDGDRTIAATTGPEPTVGLVFYDLKSCLRSLADEPKPAPKKRAPRKKKADDGAS
jgi:predicted regulator of Ras-like GTPase activity (Roadblock/LC7/MglB family)